MKRTLGALAGVMLLSACTRSPEAQAAGPPVTGPEIAGTQEPILHENFVLTQSGLADLLATIPEIYRLAILDRPTEFLDLLELVAESPPELVWRIDREHPAPVGYEPADLVGLDTLTDQLDLSREGHRLRETVLADLSKMVSAARKEGVTLLISSAYRSYEYQAEVYQYWVNTMGAEEADRTSAKPGTSQHQLGTTIDFGCICDDFADSRAGIWLAQNAWEYGFSLSYPEGYEEVIGYTHESWHYRYIGRSAAEMEREYFGGLQHELLGFLGGSMTDIMMFRAETKAGRASGGNHG